MVLVVSVLHLQCAMWGPSFPLSSLRHHDSFASCALSELVFCWHKYITNFSEAWSDCNSLDCTTAILNMSLLKTQAPSSMLGPGYKVPSSWFEKWPSLNYTIKSKRCPEAVGRKAEVHRTDTSKDRVSSGNQSSLPEPKNGETAVYTVAECWGRKGLWGLWSTWLLFLSRWETHTGHLWGWWGGLCDQKENSFQSACAGEGHCGEVGKDALSGCLMRTVTLLCPCATFLWRATRRATFLAPTLEAWAVAKSRKRTEAWLFLSRENGLKVLCSASVVT